MPLDPTLARGFDLPKFDNPIEQMGGALTNALMMDKVGNLSDERMRNAMLDQIIGQNTGRDGKVNQAGVLYDLGVAGLGRSVMSQQKSYDESAKTQSETAENAAQAVGAEATALKSRNEAQKLFDDHLATLLTNVTDIGQLHPRIVQAYKNDVAYNLYGGEQGAMAAAANDLAEAQAAIDSGPEGLKNWVTKRVVGKDSYKNNYQTLSDVNGQTFGAAPEYGTPGFTPIKEFGPKPAGSVVNIDQRAEGTYQKTVAEGEAKNYLALKAQAGAADGTIANLERGLALVDKAYTGFYANGATTANAMFKTNPDSVKATQELKQILSTDMFQNIAALRAAGVTLGSITEKEFAQLQATVPAITDSPETIKAWMKRAIKFNQDVKAKYLVAKDQGLQLPGPPEARSPAPASRGVSAPPQPPKPPSAPKVPSPPIVEGRTKKGTRVPVEAIKELMADDTPATREEFDQDFGEPGLAKRLLGGGPTGQVPFKH